MDRRQFVKWSAISFCASQIFSPSRFVFAKKVAELKPEGTFSAKNRRESFERNKREHLWLKAFEGVKDFSFQKGSISLGAVPRGISGVFYRVGPGWLSDKKDRFNHWMEGEGLIQSITVRSGMITHQARVVQTTPMVDFRLNENRFYHTLATKNKKAKLSYFPPNQSVLPLKGNRLLALADGAFSQDAKPWEVDRSSLNVKDFSSTDKKDIASKALSSHPIRDHNRSIWNAIPDFVRKGIVLEQYFSTGALRKSVFFPLKNVGYFHSFVLTENKVIVVVPPLFFSQAAGKDYLSSFFWEKQSECTILVFDKESFTLDFSVKTPAFFAMHFINGFEKQGKIVFDGLCYEDGNILLQAYRDLMKGRWCKEESEENLYFPKLNRFIVDKDGVKRELMSRYHYEMPSIDPRDLGQEYGNVVLLKKKSRDKLSGGVRYYRSVAVRDMKTGWENSYRYPSFYFPEEHIYLPDKKKSSGKGGWVLGSVYDLKKEKTRIFVFDAEKINEGPVAGALLAYGMPISAHGRYVADF